MMFRQLSVSDITDDLLIGYQRYTKTTHIHRLTDGSTEIIPNQFEEDWDTNKLRDISQYLRDCAIRGGIVIVGEDNGHTVAFGNLEPHRYPHGYRHMPYLHVSRTHRGMGYGKQLFALLEQAARIDGAEKLYISTHPSVETQAFYASVGCRLAEHTIPELVALEPDDIQLEKVL